MAETMAEYDAIEDVPTTVRAVSQPACPSASIYDLQGRRLDTAPTAPGIYIADGQKKAVK